MGPNMTVHFIMGKEEKATTPNKLSKAFLRELIKL